MNYKKKKTKKKEKQLYLFILSIGKKIKDIENSTFFIIYQ